MEAYIYTYVNKETKKTYIGARYKYKGSCYDDFNIKYFSSSKDKEFLKDMADGKLEGQIVLVMNDDNADKKIFEVEAKMIKAYWDKYGKENSYNHYAKGKFNTAGTHRHISEEQRKKISIANKGKHRSYETRVKIGAYKKGRIVSDETRKKLSIAKKGKLMGEKNPFYNKHHSDETRKKISISNKGRKMSDATKAKFKIKYKWMTPDGDIKIMDKRNAKHYHPDWKLIEE